MNYTSRSAIETPCKRKRYLNYFYDGIGIVPAGRSIPLVTGTCVHKGIEHMARWLKKKGGRFIEHIRKESQPIIEEAVQIGKQQYLDELTEKKFYGKGVTTDAQQQFTIGEQLAITEALIRAWGMRELPNLHQRFQVYEVEKEIAVPLTSDIILESRCDILLKERLGKDIYCYSLKTTKDYSKWIERGYRDDLQGLLEMYAAEQYLREQNKKHKGGIKYLESMLKGDTVNEIKKLLANKIVADTPMAVKFCFLVKGKREEEKRDGEGTGSYHTTNSLIRGYRKYSTTGVEYSHSLYFPNSNNQSGTGRLGKGWEPFNVWTDEGDKVGGVKGWMEMLDAKVKDHSSNIWIPEIQPECGDIISKYVVTPVESFRDERELEETIEQVRTQEIEIYQMVQISRDAGDFGLVQHIWMQNRRSCHYPDECEYIPICHLREPYTDKPVSMDIRDKPIESGYYEKRRPHHQLEKEGVNAIDRIE